MVVTSLTAEDFYRDNRNTETSSQQLSPLERLKARSAHKRILEMHSVWQKGTNLEVIEPEISQAAHIVKVIDVDSFRQTPTLEPYSYNDSILI